MERVLSVGLDEAETEILKARTAQRWVCAPQLPRYELVDGVLRVESQRRAGTYLDVDRVVVHGIFEDDFDFFTALSLWRGPVLPSARGLLDCRLRLPCLARAMRVSRFASAKRGFARAGHRYRAPQGADTVGKWGNWHCGSDKVRFREAHEPEAATVYEPFFPGDAVRIVLVGERHWQVRLRGDDWLKSIHHPEAALMEEVDEELLEDTRALARYFELAIIGVDYIAGPQGKHLLEVNHIPNVTVFEPIRAAFLDLVVDWLSRPARG